MLDHRAAARILTELERLDVSRGGLWSATASLWQRYDRPWDGVGGLRGSSVLLGSIGVMYDSPNRQQITLYRVTLSPHGAADGWTVEKVCDDALSWVGLTLASCTRAELHTAPAADPFHR